MHQPSVPTADLEGLLARAHQRRRLPDPPARRILRVRAGLSQGQLAAALGVSPAALSRWESGTRTPVGPFAEAYGAALDRLAVER
jgi:DNA-binding XRE family transcriptional regulator